MVVDQHLVLWALCDRMLEFVCSLFPISLSRRVAPLLAGTDPRQTAWLVDYHNDAKLSGIQLALD